MNMSEKLNKKRNLFRTLMMICLCVEIVAVVLMFTAYKLPGLLIGLVAFSGYFVVSRIGKRKVNDEVARIQMQNLGLEDFAYVGRLPLDKAELAAAELLPSRCMLDTPLFQHAARGKMDGRELTVGEVTLSFPRVEGKQSREFNNGTFVMAKLARKVEFPLVLLGNRPFRVSLTRKDYEADGFTQSPVGGKNKGWYLFAPNGKIPAEEILEKWSQLCEKVDGQAVMAVCEDRIYAFFCSLFATDTFQLSEEITEKDLKKKVFHYLPDLVQVVNTLDA